MLARLASRTRPSASSSSGIVAGSSPSCASSSVRSRHLCGPRPPGSTTGRSRTGPSGPSAVTATVASSPGTRSIRSRARSWPRAAATARSARSPAVARPYSARALAASRSRCAPRSSGEPAGDEHRLVEPRRGVGARRRAAARAARREGRAAPFRAHRRRLRADRGEQRRGLRRRLARLLLPIGVGDDAAAGAEPDARAADLEGADRDAQLEARERAREADRAGVGLAAGRLELRDHVERGQLRRARDRAGREASRAAGRSRRRRRAAPPRPRRPCARPRRAAGPRRAR